MRRPIFLILINAMILLVIFALLTQSLVIVQRLAVVDNVAGIVEVQRNGRGAFRVLAERDFVKTGDIVRSSRNGSAEFAWADGTRWKMLPDTQLCVKKATSNLVRHTDNSQLELERGKVFLRVTRHLKANSQFSIKTPHASVDVTGTVFSVAAQNGKTRVEVFKGQVYVRALKQIGSGRSIAPNHYVTVGDTIQSWPADDSVRATFQAQSNIVLPQLDASLQNNNDGTFIINGSTESSDRVTINGESVRTLGNGVFRRKMNRPQSGQFIVISTDIHGATRVQTLLVPLQ